LLSLCRRMVRVMSIPFFEVVLADVGLRVGYRLRVAKIVETPVRLNAGAGRQPNAGPRPQFTLRFRFVPFSIPDGFRPPSG